MSWHCHKRIPIPGAEFLNFWCCPCISAPLLLSLECSSCHFIIWWIPTHPVTLNSGKTSLHKPSLAHSGQPGFTVLRDCQILLKTMLMCLPGFPGGSDGKESAWHAGDLGLILKSGRSPGEENGNPPQYSCLENSMNRGAWRATVCGGHTESDMTGWLTPSLCICQRHCDNVSPWLCPLLDWGFLSAGTGHLRV